MKLVTTFAVLAVAALAATPVSAKTSCSGADMGKLNTTIAAMPPSDQRMALNAEFAKAVSAMNKGDMRACNASLKQLEMTMAKKK